MNALVTPLVEGGKDGLAQFLDKVERVASRCGVTLLVSTRVVQSVGCTEKRLCAAQDGNEDQ
jgi:hypothetical protein